MVGRYVLPYISIMEKLLPEDHKIFLVTYEKNQVRPKATRAVESANLSWIPLQYYGFGLRAGLNFVKHFFRLWRLIRKEKIDEIHPWCTPPGVMGLFLSLVTGKRLVLDSFEPHAEPMAESNTWKRNSMAFKILFWFEGLMSKKASIIIAANPNMKSYMSEKFGLIHSRFYSKPACVNVEDFSLGRKKNSELLKKLGLENKIVCVYAGKFGGSYLEEEIFQLLCEAYQQWGDSFRFLLLNGQDEEYIKSLAKKANFNYSLVIKRFVPYGEVPDYMGLGDFGLVPFKPVPSKRYGSPIKTGEYLAMGIPIIITKDISSDSDIIEVNQAGYVIKNLNTIDYKKAILRINDMILLENRTRHERQLRDLAEKYYSFDIASEVYAKIYD